MPLTTTLVVTLIGLAAISRFEHLGALEADTVMPRLLTEWAASGPAGAALAILVFLGALAAMMSTADSVLLSLGSIIAEDLLGGSRLDPNTTRLGKRIAALVMAGAVILALSPRLTIWRLIELKMELLIQCVPAFLMAIHWRGFRARPALWGQLREARVPGAVGRLGLRIDVGVEESLVLPVRDLRTIDAESVPR